MPETNTVVFYGELTEPPMVDHESERFLVFLTLKLFDPEDDAETRLENEQLYGSEPNLFIAEGETAFAILQRNLQPGVQLIIRWRQRVWLSFPGHSSDGTFSFPRSHHLPFFGSRSRTCFYTVGPVF